MPKRQRRGTMFFGKAEESYFAKLWGSSRFEQADEFREYKVEKLLSELRKLDGESKLRFRSINEILGKLEKHQTTKTDLSVLLSFFEKSRRRVTLLTKLSDHNILVHTLSKQNKDLSASAKKDLSVWVRTRQLNIEANQSVARIIRLLKTAQHQLSENGYISPKTVTGIDQEIGIFNEKTVMADPQSKQ